MLSQAWVWRGEGRLALEPWEVREPGPGEVRLAVRAAGVCSTDLHVLAGGVSFVEPPHVMGHEGAGVVEAVGPGVSAALVGQRCAVDTVLGCGRCRFCRDGRKHLCPEVQEIGQTMPGMWARHCLVPAANLYPLAAGTSFAAATQMETLHCVLGGVDKLGMLAGETALVLGCGIAGILFARLLQLQGASHVTVTGTRERRLALARQYGATESIDVRRRPLPEALDGRRFDAVVETVGSRESIATAGLLTDGGGRVLLFGIPPGHKAEIDVLDGIWREVRFLPTGNAPRAWPRVAALVAAGLVDLEPLADRRFPFVELDRAIATARDDREGCLRAVVETG